MFKFIIPFNYLYISRLKSRLEVFSLICIYPLYLFLYIFFFYNVGLVPDAFLYISLLIAWILVYEIGYLENDAITIQKEKNPNIRIGLEDISFVQTHFRKIVSMRIFLFLILLVSIYLTKLLSLNQIVLFSVYVSFTRLVFFIHNTIRSRWNIVTYLFLCISKYFIFLIIFFGWKYGIEPYLIILFSFPILRTIEHGVKKKYELVKIQEFIGALDNFRAIYYGILFFTACCFYFFGILNVAWIWSLGYFFIFRLGIFMMIKRGVYSRKPITNPIA